MDRQACQLTLDRVVEVSMPVDGGSFATLTGTDQTSVVFQGNSAATGGTVSLVADVPVQGLPCTFAYAGSATRESSSTQPPPTQPPPTQPPPTEPPPTQPPPAQPPPMEPPPTQPPEQRLPMADGIWHVRYSFNGDGWDGGGACGSDYRRYFEHDVEPSLTGYDDCSRRHSERRVPGGWELVVVDECRFSNGTLTLFLEDGASVATGTLLLLQYGDIDHTPAAICTLHYDTTATRP
jgi:hypothetical protein